LSNKLDTVINTSIQAHLDGLIAFIKALPPMILKVKLGENRETRTAKQNAYYWAAIIKEVCEFHGFNPNDASSRNCYHEKLKLQFNSEEFIVKRPMIKVSTESQLMEYNGVIDYLESKNWTNLTVQDGCVLFPLFVFKNISKDEQKDGGAEEVFIEEVSVQCKTTTISDTAEFSQYIERIRDHYIIEHDFYIAPPSQYDDKNISEFD
jgi:hypothetical protein